MARSTKTSRPARSLVALLALIGGLFGLVAAGVTWSDAQWSPKLALDLEGGTQVVLTPVLAEGSNQQITPENLTEAVNVIRQRVDGTGVAEAEVTTNNNNIVVAIPGKNVDEQTLALVQASAQLQFRAVLTAAGTGAPVEPIPTSGPTDGATNGATTSPTDGATPAPTGTATPGQTAGAVTPTPGPSTNGKNIPAWARKAATAPATEPAATAPATEPAATAPATEPPATPGAAPTDASDLAWITSELQAEFDAETCTDLTKFQGITPDPKKPLVTCLDDASEKYILGPAEVLGTNIDGASSGIGTNSQGLSTGQWEVTLDFDGTGTRQFADVTTRLAQFPPTDSRNRFGIVLDGVVISAPTTNERIPNGQARISGNFTSASAQALASQLKFGALPISFRTETVEQISATLGTEQLRNGLLAGLIGLALVVVYSLLQYRALGLVTVASLVVVGVVTYGLITLLGWRQGYRLSLSGVAGLIVSIGVTADSFIVYFERIRDEVRDGKPLPVAVEAAWQRARRTIIVSDAVSFLAAVVLFTLAVGSVRGFAFTLGLTTLVDIFVTFVFTKPMVVLLARRPFFASGHPLSGFDARHLHREVAYAGRGRVRPAAARAAGAATAGATATGQAGGARAAGATIAERRAATARAADPGGGQHRSGDGPDGSVQDSAVGGTRGGSDA